LALVNVLVGYLAFADMGMGVASTKFATEAHAEGGAEEAKVVWTAALIAAVPSLLVAALLALFAAPLAQHALRLPPGLVPAATIALRLTALGFIGRSVAGVFNTPQLVRLRLDLFTIVTTGSALAQICLVPVV